MHSVHSYLVLVTLLVAGISYAEVLSERSKDLGFGFRNVVREQTAQPGAFEGVSYFAFLFYKNVEVSQSTIYSIAPSGHFALYQDGPTGDIMLFISASQSKVLIKTFPGTLASSFQWVESESRAVITLENKSTIAVVLRAA